MSTTTLQDNLILLRRRAVRRRRLSAGLAILVVVGLSLLGWAALWAGAVHHGVVQPRVAQLKVHAVAPATEHPQNMPAFAAIDRSLIHRRRKRQSHGYLGRR